MDRKLHISSLHVIIKGCLFLSLWSFVGTIQNETFHGSISPKENKTFILHLNGTTVDKYSTLTWAYSIRSKYYQNFMYSPIAYFRHKGQEDGYGTDKKCFSGELWDNYGMDPRLLQFTITAKTPGRDKECYLESDSYIVCKGSIPIGVGVKRQFYVTIGFRCGYESPLDVDYNITVVPYEDGEVPCTDWSEALNELQEPIPTGLKQLVNSCSKLYGKFSRWNILGISQYHMELLYLITVMQTKCYQLFTEFACRIVLPECKQNTVIVPCKEMCMDFNKAFSTSFDNSTRKCGLGEGMAYNISCNSLSSRTDRSANICSYEQVQCSKHPVLPEHAKIVSQNGSNASDVADISCDTFYKLSNSSYSALCWYDGQWHCSDKVTCELVMLYVLSLVVGLCVVLAIFIATVVYKFRFELKLLAFKYCSCCLCCCRCCKRKVDCNKAFDAFIAYEHYLYDYVRRNIHEPLEALGYRICVDYANIRFSDNLLRKIPEVIGNSSRIIIVLNQGFLDSNWCQYELDQAIMRKLEDASFEFLVILKQDRATLKNVPRWLKGYLRTHIYIEENDPFFINKIIQGLPPVTRRLSDSGATEAARTKNNLNELNEHSRDSEDVSIVIPSHDEEDDDPLIQLNEDYDGEHPLLA